MPLLWIGVVGVLLKWLEIGPFTELSWWWVCAPLIGAIFWFEALERTFGFDRRQTEHVQYEKIRKERVAARFAPASAKKGRRTRP